MEIDKIFPGQIKDQMENGCIKVKTSSGTETKKASPNTQERMKSLCNLCFDYAVEYVYLETNPAIKFTIGSLLDDIAAESKKKIPFTPEMVADLWKFKDFPFVDMLLINIYTGYRASELSGIQLSDTHLDEDVPYFFGGLKTEAGKYRIVPIHPDIEPLVRKRVQEAQKYGSTFLFNDPLSQTGMHMTYDKYRRRFEQISYFMKWQKPNV